jgi:hypothetical protein
MGITRITYLFDIERFRDVFEPISQELEKKEYRSLKEEAHYLATNNLVSWILLDQFGYYKDDFGREDEEFEEIGTIVRFWILSLISSFCEGASLLPLDPVQIANLLKELEIEDKETICKLQIGRPLGALLLPGIEFSPAFDRNDSKWPYWCKSYGSLGWLNQLDINDLYNLLNERVSQKNGKFDENKFMILRNVLEEAIKKKRGLFLGVNS